LRKALLSVCQLFQYAGERGDGAAIIYPNYYIRQAGVMVCTDNVKKMAGEDVQQRKRLSAPTEDVYVATLLDLDARRRIDNGLRPFFAGMLAAHMDSDVIDRWIRWRSARRLRISPVRCNRRASIESAARECGPSYGWRLGVALRDLVNNGEGL
jgi:hypothetical protein